MKTAITRARKLGYLRIVVYQKKTFGLGEAYIGAPHTCERQNHRLLKENTADFMNRFAKGEDGKAAYQISTSKGQKANIYWGAGFRGKVQYERKRG